MNRFVRYLLILAFLFVPFTISFASTVCVGKPINTKDYVIFQTDELYQTVTCSLRGGKYLCCTDIPSTPAFRVTYVTLSNETLQVEFNLLERNYGDIHVVKAFSREEAFITVTGKEGNYLLEESIPKENVETATDIVTEGMILSFDPTIAWFVSLKDGEPATVSYYVRRGSVPATMPSVSLAECSMRIVPVSSELLRKNDQFFLFYTFDVYFGEKKVVPSKIDVYINNDRVEGYKIDPKTMSIEVFAPVGKEPKEIEVKIKTGVGSCKTTFAQTIHPEIEEGLSSTWLYLLLGGALLVLLLLWREVRHQ